MVSNTHSESRSATSIIRSTSAATRLSHVAAHILLLVVAVVSVAPFIWMFLGSFKTFTELTAYPPSLLPKHWTLVNYQTVLFQINFPHALLNSVVVGCAVTIGTLLTSSLAGYVFAKYRFWGKEQLFIVLLSTMMIPFTVVLVPLYVTVAHLGMNDSLWGLTVTALCNTFGIFMMRQFIEGVPSELIDAGRIDGASEWWIFSRIIVPLSTTALSALAVFVFMWNWDSFLWPLVLLTSPQVKTLPLVLASLTSIYWTNYEIWITGSVLTVIPTLILYAAAQKQFIRGIALTGMKA